jgi:glycosyltransferase involved in cell wall biosynthesis
MTTVHAPFDARIFHRECVSLANSGFRTTLMAFTDEAGSRDGVRVVALGPQHRKYGRLELWRRLRRTRAAFRVALREKADVYHIHDPELIATAIALKRRTGARVIYDCHEDNVGYMFQKASIPRFLRAPLAAAIEVYERRAARRLDAVVTADDGVRQRFERFGARTLTVYNFPRLEFFDNSATITKSFDLVYHGSLPTYHVEECFAIDDALRRRGRYVRWLLFGRFADIGRARAGVMARGAADRFGLEESVPHAEVARRVSTARIGIIPLPDLPKFRHNIPTKLFEFMALGLPVVLSDMPPSRPFVGDGKCALAVPPSDAEGFADAIIRLLDQPSLRDEMGREGRRRVESEYNWKPEGTKLVNLYRSLLESAIA